MTAKNPLAGITRPPTQRAPTGFRLATDTHRALEEMRAATGATRTALVEKAVADLHQRWLASRQRRA